MLSQSKIQRPKVPLAEQEVCVGLAMTYLWRS